MKEERSNTKYRIIKQASSIFRTPKAIVSMDQSLTICPHCAAKLEQYHTLIPVGDGMEADIPGVWCRRCDKLYVDDGASVRKILTDNPLTKGFTLDDEELWDYTNEKRKRANRSSTQSFNTRGG